MLLMMMVMTIMIVITMMFSHEPIFVKSSPVATCRGEFEDAHEQPHGRADSAR